MKTIMRRTLLSAAFLLAGLVLVSTEANGQQLTFQFKNPAFGGNPYNYSWLMSSAQAQNPYDDRDETDRFIRDPLADFEQSLQRQILNELSREIVLKRFGENLDLTEAGQFDLGDFLVEIVPGIDGATIRVLNKLTGDESTITIPTF